MGNSNGNKAKKMPPTEWEMDYKIVGHIRAFESQRMCPIDVSSRKSGLLLGNLL